MVTFYEIIPEIIPLAFVVILLVLARCFNEPLAYASEVINQSEFKSLQQPLYDERNNIVYT
jgi:hypothetical protein